MEKTEQGAGFVLAQLASIRAAFSAARHHADTPFTPQHTIQTPSRVIHLHFANNDQFLVISLESGGIALYRLTDLLDGKVGSALPFSIMRLESVHRPSQTMSSTFPFPFNSCPILPNDPSFWPFSPPMVGSQSSTSIPERRSQPLASA